MVQGWGKINKVFSKSWKVMCREGSLRTIIVNRKENFSKVSLPKLSDNQVLEYEGVINENELLKALNSMDVMIKH